MPTTHPNGEYALTVLYSVPDDAWYLELGLVADRQALIIGIVPDEDPAREPTVCFNSQGQHVDIPYDVMRWFMDEVEDEIRTSRAWMRLRPELVELIHQLRQEYLGVIDDADVPAVLAKVRAAIPEADVPAVLEAAFGRNPAGTA
ncbi:hypothetical protein E6W39_32590 [Kitasatospora acidiphila]|uniref:Uncharacterized protein n=1 Tax=Kitasatospora acidiphila TaxID=2567942 RepID=A0A540WB11_9ACTN|nr:hypothetical protein [Kitasatospora acidiphila]TQF06097.1 hypothetical protein E6W39_32590 [Kitasatospora acidiphila]